MIETVQHFRNKLQFEIDSWDLKECLNSDQEIVVVDARSPESFYQEHLPGAINLPHRTIDKDSTLDLDRLPVYVCYCDGVGCNASTKAALKLAEIGFKVKELIGGLDWWKRDGYPTSKSAEPLRKSDVDCGC